MKNYILFLLISILFSCKQKEEISKAKEVEEIVSESLFKKIENPSKGKAHLPRLVAQNGVLHMSWVEEEDSP